MSYDYDDPATERSVTVGMYREQGLPASLAADLIDRRASEAGHDEVAACHWANGQLAFLVSPEHSILTHRAFGRPEHEALGILAWLTDVALEHMSPEQLAAVREDHEDSLPDFHRDEVLALAEQKASVVRVPPQAVRNLFKRNRRMGHSTSAAATATLRSMMDAARRLTPRPHTTPPMAVTRSGARARGAGRPKAQASRSSAASGDSGDPDPGEPPRPAPLAFGCLTREQRGELDADTATTWDRRRVSRWLVRLAGWLLLKRGDQR